MLLGVVGAKRWRSERWPRFAVADIHRNLTLLALVFLVVHILTAVADSFAPIGLKDAFIPFVSSYRPIWLGFGTLAFDLLLALTVTSLLRRHVGYRAWRLLHWTSYAVWPLALVHGLGTGSDARTGWMSLLTFSCIAVVAGAVAARLLGSRPGRQILAGSATIAVAIGLVAWYRTGPAQRGWAARAGTPSSLLKATSTRQPVTQLATASTGITGPFSGTLIGRMSSSGPDSYGDAAIAIALAERSSEPGRLDLTLWGSALDGGGLAMNTSKVTFQPSTGGRAYTGTVVGLDGTLLDLDLTSPSGDELRMTLRLRIDAQAGTVTGTVHGSPSSSSSGETE
jgi:sulfoxide reductase heme-binding subunit YedZ